MCIVRRMKWAIVLLTFTGLAAANPTKSATFSFQGPGAINGTGSYSVIGGAINTLVISPFNDSAWVGTVNGGVWHTTSFHASPAPTWVPMSDHVGSLSIAALDLDPLDPNRQTLVAAIGHTSSHSHEGGPLTGVIRSIDGGQNWSALGATTLAGEDLVGVIARGSTIIVAAKAGTHGMWISTDSGQTFNPLTGTAGLPEKFASSLIGDPTTPTRLWVALAGSGGGVFRSYATGGSWTSIGSSASGALASAYLVVLTAQTYAIAGGTHTVVYAGMMINNALSEIAQFITTNGITTMWVYPTIEMPPVNPSTELKLSMLADPTVQSTLYVAGDAGDVYRCSGPPPQFTCTAISNRSSKQVDQAPHPDSRGMAMLDNILYELDDGGIYRRTPGGTWSPRIGNLAITETYSCAYDHLANVITCGEQDTGVSQQPTPNATVWTQALADDGGAASFPADHETCPSGTCSVRYYSLGSLKSFTRKDCDANNVCTDTTPNTPLDYCATPSTCTQLRNDSAATEVTPIAADRFDSTRLAVAVSSVYESTDSGATAVPVSGFTGTATRAIALGGAHAGFTNPNVLYVGSSDDVFVRTTSGGSLSTTGGSPTTYGTPERLALDPTDWKSVWVVTSTAKVMHLDSTGWHEVTGDLAPGSAGVDTPLKSIAFVPGTNPFVAVGASDGVYVAAVSDLAHWFKLSGALPDAVVEDLQYDTPDDLLIIATLGRSAWSLPQASALFSGSASRATPAKPAVARARPRRSP